MPRLTKRKKLQQDQYSPEKEYTLEKGIALVKSLSGEKFDGSMDLAVNLNINVKDPLHMVRQAVNLPHGTGKSVRVLVFCTPDKEEEAKAAGADHVGLQEYVEKVEQGWSDVDVVIAMPSIMPTIGKIGKLLGPKGLMPNAKTGNVTQEVGQAVRAVKAGKVTIKTDKTGIVHSSIGRISFSVAYLKENCEEVLNTLRRNKPATVKGNYIKGVSLSSTMGPGITIRTNSI